VAAHASPAVLGLVALLPSLVIVALIAARRRKPGAHTLAATHAVAATGACGMIWSLLVLFSYQTRAGALYGRLGWLTALFMLGLALGGGLASRAASARAETSRRWLLAVLGAALLLALLMPLALAWLGGVGAVALELSHGGLLLLAGAATGAVFPAGAGSLLASGRGARGAAGGLEAADHAGAALAAMAGGILLVPALGLAGTAWLTVGLEGLALAGLALSGPGSRARLLTCSWPGT
jgi:spermidine synthase